MDVLHLYSYDDTISNITPKQIYESYWQQVILSSLGDALCVQKATHSCTEVTVKGGIACD